MEIPADASIDLQIHTAYSDGQWRPDELFRNLARERFRVVAITDHDSLEHVGELAQAGAAYGVHVLPAVELTTNWRGKSAHLLCYSAAFAGDALATLARGTENAQTANTLAVYDELRRRGYAFANTSALPVRPIDNARLLVAHGYAATLEDALRMIADAGYRSITVPLADAVVAAHVSNALAVLAHPGRGGGEIQRYDPPLLADLLADIPLDGIEVRYPTYTAEQVSDYEAFAKEHGLLMSAGSDSHGPAQRLPVAYPAHLCADLLRRCGVNVDDIAQ